MQALVLIALMSVLMIVVPVEAQAPGKWIKCAVNNKIYVIGGRLGGTFIFTASNTNVVEEYDPVTDQWGLVKARMPTERSGGRGGSTTGGST